MNNKGLQYIGSEVRENRKILLFNHPKVTDSDPGEDRLRTHDDWRPMTQLPDKNIAQGSFRVTDQAIEIDVTDILFLAKNEKIAGGLALTSFDGKTTVTLPFELTGGNNKATITAPSSIDFNESQRGVIDSTDRVTVSDRDAGEARLMPMEKQSMKLTRGDNTEVEGAFFYSISPEGKFIVDASQLPQMREGEVFSTTVEVESRDGTAKKQLKLSFHGENDPAQIENGAFAVSTDMFSDHDRLNSVLV